MILKFKQGNSFKKRTFQIISVDMRDLKSIHQKTKEMLECFGQKKAFIYFKHFSNHRIGINERRSLRQKLVWFMETQKENKLYKRNFSIDHLLKPGGKPKCSFASLSISHCPYLGAFVFAFDTKISIGFDIENRHRVTKEVLYRISLKEEVVKSPAPALLWTAKEAGFKCVSAQTRNLQLNKCLIFDWRESHKKDVYFLNVMWKSQN